jgi:hypothetical protein
VECNVTRRRRMRTPFGLRFDGDESSQARDNWHAIRSNGWLYVVQETTILRERELQTKETSNLLCFTSVFNIFTKVKVKVTLEQAMMAHMRSRRSSTLSLSRALCKGVTSTPSPGPIYPKGKTPGTHCTGGWVGHKAGLDGRGKSRLHRDSIPEPFGP